MELKVIVSKGEAGYYVARVPALKGCHTWGATLPEALEMAQEAIGGYLAVLQEDGDSPPPDTPNVNVDMAETAEAFVCRLEVREAAAVV